ncbi:MAG TPA: hypothetical protein VMR23_04015 [Candidatus Limnocylindria bacterium]|nr:hypothetical protein [Candidatus Limnocylindria bacterium]
MVNREHYPTTHKGCEISVATEKMPDGNFGVVAKVTHDVGGAVHVMPLPVPHRTFETEEAAQAFGVMQAQEYIDRMEPAA